MAEPDVAPATSLEPTPAIGPASFRTASIAILATVCGLLALRAARPVLVPVFVSILLAHALEPFVAWLTCRRVPRLWSVIVVYLVLATIVGGLGRAVLRNADTFLEDLPRAIAATRDSRAAGAERAQTTPAPPGPPVSRVPQKPEQTAPPAPSPGARKIAVVQPRLDLRPQFFGAGRALATAIVQISTVALLTFLLLATGDRYRDKLIVLGGSTLADRRITLEVIQSIERQIERYLIARLLISVIVAVATGVAVGLLGLSHAPAWGAVAGALNVFPIVGPTAAIVLITVAAFLEFRTLGLTAAACGLTSVIAALEGNLISPWLTSRAGEVNAVAVFVSVLFWGWMWDTWGLLLAVPIMVALKAAADHVEPLRPIGELLGR